MSTSVPSFLYAGIDSETLALARELEDLGGGDACATNMEIHSFVNGTSQFDLG